MFAHLRKALAESLWGVVLDGQLSLEKLAKKARRAEDKAKAAGAELESGHGSSSEESKESRKAEPAVRTAAASNAKRQESSLSEEESEPNSPQSKTSPAESGASSGEEAKSPRAASKADAAAPAEPSAEKSVEADASQEPDFARSSSATPEPKAAPPVGAPDSKKKAKGKGKAAPVLSQPALPAAPKLVLKTNKHDERRLEQQAYNSSRNEYLQREMKADNDAARSKKREASADRSSQWDRDKAYERWQEQKAEEWRDDWEQDTWWHQGQDWEQGWGSSSWGQQAWERPQPYPSSSWYGQNVSASSKAAYAEQSPGTSSKGSGKSKGKSKIPAAGGWQNKAVVLASLVRRDKFDEAKELCEKFMKIDDFNKNVQRHESIIEAHGHDARMNFHL